MRGREEPREVAVPVVREFQCRKCESEGFRVRVRARNVSK